MGFPEGSVHSFLLYISDLKDACSSDFSVCVDESAILVSHEDLAAVEKSLSEELQNFGMSDNIVHPFWIQN